MTIRTQVKAGGGQVQHNEALRVRSTVKAGGKSLNHNEALKVRSTVKAGGLSSTNHSEALKIRSTVKAGGRLVNHSETLRTGSAPVVAMLRQPRTTSRKEDRLELLVIRAGLRAGRRNTPGSRR
jgi:hypothetical protein